MIERILTPLDGSSTAEAILPYVRRLARLTKAEIVLARAIPMIGVEGGQNALAATLLAGTEYLDAARARLESWGFRARAIVRAGGAAQTVLALASETRASLLALATHGRTGAARLVLGSVSESILRSTSIPVFAVRPFWTYELQPPGGIEEKPIRTILVPVSSGGLSLRVLPHAVRMAKLFGARVMILHATSASEKASEDAIADVAERFRMEGIEATTLVEPGNPVDNILSACRSRAVDLVVMSTHGRGGVRRWVMGSVTEETLRQARVPLLIVGGDASARTGRRAADVRSRAGSASSR